jgi:hypothetical protein
VERRLNPVVFLAIYCIPVVFAWLLLRKGYSRDVRLGGFAFATLFGFLPVIILLIVPMALGR